MTWELQLIGVRCMNRASFGSLMKGGITKNKKKDIKVKKGGKKKGGKKKGY